MPNSIFAQLFTEWDFPKKFLSDLEVLVWWDHKLNPSYSVGPWIYLLKLFLLFLLKNNSWLLCNYFVNGCILSFNWYACNLDWTSINCCGIFHWLPFRVSALSCLMNVISESILPNYFFPNILSHDCIFKYFPQICVLEDRKSIIFNVTN